MATAEQEVVEKKPKTVSEPKPLPSGYWDKWIGKQMVFQTKSHALITGTLKEFRNMFLLIEQPRITGNKYAAKPKEVLLDRNFISHFHEVCELEEIAKDGAD